MGERNSFTLAWGFVSAGIISNLLGVEICVERLNPFSQDKRRLHLGKAIKIQAYTVNQDSHLKQTPGSLDSRESET